MKPDDIIVFSKGGHLSGPQLVNRLYAPPDSSPEWKHLQACQQCRAEWESYRLTVAQLTEWPMPERDAAYGRAVWHKIAGEMHNNRHRQTRRRSVLLLLGAAAAVVTLLFCVSSFIHSKTSSSPAPAVAVSPAQGQNLLEAAVQDHLAQTSQLLSVAQSANKLPQAGVIADLLANNRLYRQTAEQEHNAQLAARLSELEVALLDLQHEPRPSAAQMTRGKTANLPPKHEASHPVGVKL
jgi:hypothetical protein